MNVNINYSSTAEALPVLIWVFHSIGVVADRPAAGKMDVAVNAVKGVYMIMTTENPKDIRTLQDSCKQTAIYLRAAYLLIAFSGHAGILWVPDNGIEFV